MIVKCNAEKTVMHFSLECSDLLQGNLFFFMAASVYDHVYLSKRASATFKVFEAVFQKTLNLIMIISSYHPLKTLFSSSETYSRSTQRHTTAWLMMSQTRQSFAWWWIRWTTSSPECSGYTPIGSYSSAMARWCTSGTLSWDRYRTPPTWWRTRHVIG